MSQVLVFKTNVKSEDSIQKLSHVLDTLIKKEGHRNFDLEDCENILRVEKPTTSSTQVSKILLKQGFLCEEIH